MIFHDPYDPTFDIDCLTNALFNGLTAEEWIAFDVLGGIMVGY
jgi:hypothetical protein